MQEEKILEAVLGRNRADYMEVRVDEFEETNLVFQGPELEQLDQSGERGGCIRARVKGGWGFVSTNRVEDLPAQAEECAGRARLVGGKEIPWEAQAQRQADIKVQLTEDPRQVSLQDKVELAQGYNRRLLGHKQITSTAVTYRDTFRRTWFANSEGTRFMIETCYCGISIGAVAKKNGVVQQAHESFGQLGGYELVRGKDEEVENVARRAVDLLTAKPAKGGTYTVILDPKLSGVFAHEAFGHLSEADFLYENPQMLEVMRLGRRFGEDFLNITDDGTLPLEAGSLDFDDEGIAAHRTPLIVQGVLHGRLHSRETAAKLGEAPTGNGRALDYHYAPVVRMTNTFIEPGEMSWEDMLAGTADGIYAKGALGGMTNGEMFTFSPAEAYVIRGGEIKEKLRDLVLTGNVFQTLTNIDAVGSDLQMHGGLGGCGKGAQSPLRVGVGGPHVRIREVVVGAA